MGTIPLLVAAFGTVLALAGCVTSPKTQRVSFSELLENPERFDGARVALTACAFNSMHGTVLLECGRNDSKPIALGIPPTDDPIYPIYDRFFGVRAQFSTPRVRADITGRYEWHSGQTPSRILRLERVLGAHPYEP